MPHSFIDRNNNNYETRNNETGQAQKKVSLEAQLKDLNDDRVRDWGLFDNYPAQMFARDEDSSAEAKGKEEDEKVQAKKGDEELQKKATSEKEKKQSGSSGTKTNLPNDVRGKMESSFGTDFSGVNIHANSGEASNIGALAYTQGSDVHFAPGQYNPGTQKGQELLGHELTHVVQQREGRVKPTKQGKGMPINDNPSLEKEADEMGAKAAQGKVTDVTGKGSGVQRQGDVDISVYDWLMRESKIKNVRYLGAIYKKYTNDKGEQKLTDIRNIVVPTKEQWIEMLKHGDQLYYSYIHGFLVASLNDSWFNMGSQLVMEQNPDGSVSNKTDYYYAAEKVTITDAQKQDFLEALYAVGRDEKDVDMPKESFLVYKSLAWTRFYSYLGAFISQNQYLLVDRLTENNQILSSEGIQNLAGLGIDANADLAPDMIAGAFASAVASAKYLIEELAVQMNNELESKDDSFDLSLSDKVSKYAMIIDDTLKGYDKELKAISEKHKAQFETMWSIIPFSGVLGKIKNPIVKHFANIALEEAKGALSDEISKMPSNGLSTMREFHDEFRREVNVLTAEFKEAAGGNLSNTVIENKVRSFKNSFK